MIKSAGVKPVDLRRQNYQAIIQLFRDRPNLAVRDITEVVSLSKTAVTNILSNLCDLGIIRPIGKGTSTNQGGKRPELYALNSDYQHMIALEFSHSSCFCQLFNMDYRVVAEFRRTSRKPKGYSYTEIISLSAHAILSVLREAGLTPDQICGIVMLCGGIVLNKEGILSRPILSPQWGTDLHVLEDIRKELPFDIPLYLDNSCRYGGYFELLNHPERRMQNIITLFCSTSVGGSQIRMGHLMHGVTGLIGEYGHITTDYSFTERCNCGNYGCFETNVSESYVLRHVCKDLKMHAISSLNKKDLSMLTLDDIFQAANEGDSFARRHLDFVVQQFSVLIYNMQLTYDPDEIIIQGIYNKAEGYFQDTLRSTIRQLSLHSIQNNMKLTFSPNYISANGLPMTMIGAALFCFDQYFDQLEFFV